MLKSSNRRDSVRIKRALSHQRKKLKFELFAARAIQLDDHLFAPLCVYCGEPMSRAYWIVMHECFIKRNALPVKLQYKIMVKENCILAHNEPCHAKYGQTKEFKLRCARAQFARYGRDKIVAWVESLGLRQIVEIPREEEAS